MIKKNLNRSYNTKGKKAETEEEFGKESVSM
jgi:hypothetical protein